MTGPTLPPITLTTDFGCGSPYVAQMKAVILSLHPAATIVDLAHTIAPHDVRQAAVALEDTAFWFPPGTIHVVVVDPGVGTQRRIIYARIAGQQFLAADNGLLSCLTAQTPPQQLLSVENPAWWLPAVSATFHGRDILAPVAAHLQLGLAVDRLGPPLTRLVTLPWPQPVVQDRQALGEVVAIDTFGNLITNIRRHQLPAEAGPLAVTLPECHITHWGRTYGEFAAGTRIALFGSSDRLEIAVVEGNAAAQLSALCGTPVTVHWAL